ncbi:hypothetical protein [Acrocarpospora sp. B8E8]|uniref:Rv1733c family protein n=1 Tax=Acrocarpospora sp. B8E8 TaxID=3153572 RepID=UPI00325CAFA2
MRARTGWLMRRVRLYRPDRNPLRRPSDRWETLVVALAIGLVLLSIWPVTVVSAAVYQRGLRSELSGSGVRESVTVTLARTQTGALRWQRDDGAQVTGLVTPRVQVVGMTYQVWVDADNRVTTRPRDHADTIMSTSVAAFGLELGVLLFVWLGYMLARFLLDRGRYAQWSAAWVVAGERWRRPRQT